MWVGSTIQQTITLDRERRNSSTQHATLQPSHGVELIVALSQRAPPPASCVFDPCVSLVYLNVCHVAFPDRQVSAGPVQYSSMGLCGDNYSEKRENCHAAVVFCGCCAIPMIIWLVMVVAFYAGGAYVGTKYNCTVSGVWVPPTNVKAKGSTVSQMKGGPVTNVSDGRSGQQCDYFPVTLSQWTSGSNVQGIVTDVMLVGRRGTMVWMGSEDKHLPIGGSFDCYVFTQHPCAVPYYLQTNSSSCCVPSIDRDHTYSYPVSGISIYKNTRSVPRTRWLIGFIGILMGSVYLFTLCIFGGNMLYKKTNNN